MFVVSEPGVLSSWTPESFDLGPYVNAKLQVRFGFSINQGGVWTVSSWNLDDVLIYKKGC